MKTIKFRAWDKHNKTWITEPVGFTMSVVDGRFHIFGFDDAFADMYQIRVELQQYTNLKDQNGVEIYDGDIVERYWSDGDVVNRIHVRWLDDHAGWSINPALLEATKHNQQSGMTAHGFKVVGNIYETPELI